MTAVGPDRVEEWLDAATYPDHWQASGRKRKNKELRQYVPGIDIYDILHAAKKGTYSANAEVRTAEGGKIFRIKYDITNVVIEELCPKGHDWGEWQYDFMGGDTRKCKRCGETEMI